MLFPKLLGTSQGLSVSNFWNEYHSGADTCLVFCKQNVRFWPKADIDSHGALTICLHAGGNPASVSAGFGLDGGGCSVVSLNQKSSS